MIKSRFFTHFIVFLVLLSGCTQDDKKSDAQPGDKGTFTIAFWNIDPLDEEKAKNDQIMQYYADKIGIYDVVVIQGIKDMDAKSFNRLCELSPTHRCQVSTRRGDMSQKELYGILYRGFEVKKSIDYSYLLTKDFVRAPLTYVLEGENISFRMTSHHPDPHNVGHELREIDKLKTIEDMGQIDDFIREDVIVGTLYADCNYYKTPPADLGDWLWAIKDDWDTTTDPESCAYDRILINPQMSKRFLNAGVDQNIDSSKAQHKLVWAIFSKD